MEKICGTGIDPNAFYERLVALGIAKASEIYAAVPTLADVIDPESEQFARAQAIFPTDEAYHAELAREVSSVFEQHFVDKRVLEDGRLPFIERLGRLSEAVRSVVQTNNAAFTAYCTLARTHALPENFDADIADIDPVFRTALEIVRREIREQGAPRTCGCGSAPPRLSIPDTSGSHI